MEAAQLTQAILKKTDEFQTKGLRKILGRKHTYWDRIDTNYNIIEMASRIVNERKKGRARRIKKWTRKAAIWKK